MIYAHEEQVFAVRRRLLLLFRFAILAQEACSTCLIGPVRSVAMSRALIIVRAGETFADLRTRIGDFHDWIAEGLGLTCDVSHVDAREAPDLPEPASVAGVVVTGSHAMVSDRAPWSEQLGQWLLRCVEARVPVLGICFGHQLLAHALGGVVGYRADGRELGTIMVHQLEVGQSDPLFQHMPQVFPAHVVHEQSVLALPPGAVRLAWSSQEPCQAFRFGDCAWGVQFHPEFSATAIQAYQARLAPGAYPEDAPDTPEAARLLRLFAEYVLRRGNAG